MDEIDNLLNWYQEQRKQCSPEPSHKKSILNGAIMALKQLKKEKERAGKHVPETIA